MDGAAGAHGWIEEIALELSLVRAGLLVLVDGARPERLGDLVRALLPAHPGLEVHTDVRRVESVAHGATLVLAPKAGDADWLNLQRPVFARRELKVVLWCDGETSTALARKAVDFFDWISHRHDCPAAPAAHGVEGIRSALRARAPGVEWTGGDLDAAFLAARPGRSLRRVSAASPYEALLEAARDAGTAWIGWTDVDGWFRLRRVRWAMAEAGRLGRAILVEPAVRSPGWWPAHGRCMALDEARARIAAAGARAPGRMASLVGLEPEAVELVATLLERGVEEDELTAEVLAARDPGAALGRTAEERGLVALGDVAAGRAVAPALRALGSDPVVETLRYGRWLAFDMQMARAGRLDRIDASWWAAHASTALASRSEGARPSADRLAMADLFNTVIRGSAEQQPLHDGEAAEVLLRSRRRDVGVWAALGSIAIALGDAESALHWASTAVATEERPATLIVLSRALELQGRFQEAEPLLRRSMDMAHRSGRPVVGDYHELAWNLTQLGRYAEAEVLLRDELTAQQEVLGEEHPLLGVFLQSLSLVLRSQGRYAEAAALLSRALEVQRRTLGSEHSGSAATAHDLALVLWKQGRDADAEALLREALGIRERLLGPEHPAYGESLRALGVVLGAQGKRDEAEALLQRALEILTHALGPEHPAVGAAQQSLADALRTRGRFAEAEALLRSALGNQERALGPGHPALGATLASLAELLDATGRRPEAVIHARRALDLAVRQRLPDEARLRALAKALAER